MRRNGSPASVRELAGRLTELRREAANSFAAGVTAELAALAMPQAQLNVAVTPAGDFGPHGADEVEIRLAAHQGAPMLPLGKGASGGELSRVMLAIEVVFAGADPVPTFVFDEVNAGVGGKAAVEVGRRLARLARLAQVIVVTHLPQVAAFADAHLVVERADDGSVTRSGITRARRRGPGDRALTDAGWPGGLRVWPGARGGAARRGGGGTRGVRAARERGGWGRGGLLTRRATDAAGPGAGARRCPRTARTAPPG